jgi:CheY-like chemotaxis protein
LRSHFGGSPAFPSLFLTCTSASRPASQSQSDTARPLSLSNTDNGFLTNIYNSSKTYPMKKILIVDHLKSHMDKEKSILDRADIKIFTAASAEEALGIHKSEKVDVIVADLDMPDIGGDRFCSMIRRDEALKQVAIIIACSGNRADIEKVRGCKANAHVTKPIRPLEFLEVVSRFLDVPERKSYRVLLQAKVEGKFENKSFYCTSQNISVSGMLIDTEKSLEKGDIVTCSFFLPGSECIVTDTQVMRAVQGAEGKISYGVRFMDLKPHSRKAVETFIENRSGKS